MRAAQVRPLDWQRVHGCLVSLSHFVFVRAQFEQAALLRTLANSARADSLSWALRGLVFWVMGSLAWCERKCFFIKSLLCFSAQLT